MASSSHFQSLLFLTLIVSSTCLTQGARIQEMGPPSSALRRGTSMQGQGMRRSSRRLMIGSTAPTCTYNECRGCKYKCRAEQVPVEGNDPINSAYHYRCVCHR